MMSDVLVFVFRATITVTQLFELQPETRYIYINIPT